MTTQDSKPTERIVLRSLSWDHTSRTPAQKIEGARRFWHGLHGTTVDPNTCFVPASESKAWEGVQVDGIDVISTGTLLGGQLLLALVESPDGSDRSTESIIDDTEAQ